jgi:AraC-like DNA-binding protein
VNGTPGFRPSDPDPIGSAATVEALASIESLEPSGSFTREVRRVITEMLPAVAPTERLVASHLGWSTRSLQRRLHEEHTTFRELLADCRRELATATLRMGTHSVSELGYQLGFSHVGAFTRAFKRWTGQTPSSYALDCKLLSRRAAERELVG